jgi:hypothetical protein
MLGHLGLASWLGCRRLAQNGPTALFRGKSELSDLHLIAFSKNFGALDPPEWRERLVVLVFHEATSEDTGVETLLPAQSFADHQSEVFGSHSFWMCVDYRWVSVHVAQIAAQAMAIRPP